MLAELMKVTPWWLWLIAVPGGLFIGGWGVALTIASCILSLTDPSRQVIYSSLLLFVLYQPSDRRR